MTNEHPEIAEVDWIDDTFRVYEKYGMYHSVTKEDRRVITGLHHDAVIQTTRWYLKQEQEGWDDDTTTQYDGEVGGKL